MDKKNRENLILSGEFLRSDDAPELLYRPVDDTITLGEGLFDENVSAVMLSATKGGQVSVKDKPCDFYSNISFDGFKNDLGKGGSILEDSRVVLCGASTKYILDGSVLGALSITTPKQDVHVRSPGGASNRLFLDLELSKPKTTLILA